MCDINLKEILVFLDDLIVFSDTLEEHESRLIHVLSRLEEYGLKFLPFQCKFFQTSVPTWDILYLAIEFKLTLKTLKTWPKL